MKPLNGTGSQPADAHPTAENPAAQITDPAQASPQGSPGGASIAGLVEDHAKGFDGFDPAIHATGPDGNPIAKKGGGWQKKRGGNMRLHAAPDRPAPAAAPGTSQPKPRVVAQVNTLEAAKATLNSLVGLLVLVFGEHWAPASDQERVALTGALKNYFDAKGAVEVSPGWGLLLVAAAYSVPRLKHEATRSKLVAVKLAMARGYLWIAGKFRRA